MYDGGERMDVMQVLTKKEVAEKFQCSVRTIDRMIQKGTLKPAKNLPGVRFTMEHIQEVLELGPDTVKSIKVKKLERELEEQRKENETLKRKMDEMKKIAMWS
jgi:DNA-binding transcriptional MerR regulator